MFVKQNETITKPIVIKIDNDYYTYEIIFSKQQLKDQKDESKQCRSEFSVDIKNSNEDKFKLQESKEESKEESKKKIINEIIILLKQL